VEKAARVFHSFAEADKAEAENYRSLTRDQCLEMLFDLVKAQKPGSEQRIEKVVRIIRLKDDK